MPEAEPLQQVDRTYVRFRGRKLSYFAGCDYFRLSSHPAVTKALQTGLRRFGLNVAASRITTGNHQTYVQLERALEDFFDAEAALVVNSGYMTSLTVAQVLAGEFSHVLIDERAHAALRDATLAFNCPVVSFLHRDAAALGNALKRLGRPARPIVLTDGMFSHDGSIAPLATYLKLLPRDGLLLVDDAHGAGILGANGRGTPELEGISRSRMVQCVTFSKAVGTYGGAILGSRQLRERIVERSRSFTGSTPLPLPLVAATLASLRVMKGSPGLRQRLRRNTHRVRGALQQRGLAPDDVPGPIIALPALSKSATEDLRRSLLAAAIYPSFLKYPGGPSRGCFRFVISSEHSPKQLDDLIRVLATNVEHHVLETT